MKQKKKPTFQTLYTEIEKKREKNSGISRTVPDQSMTIFELVTNHTIPNMPAVNEGHYHDPSGEDDVKIGQESGRLLRTLDHLEVHEELQAIEEREIKRQEEKKQEAVKKFQEKVKSREQELKNQWEKEYQEKQKPKATE